MIEIEQLCFGYKGEEKQVFEDLNLTFEENKIYGLLGKNGMGKSTLLYLISGLLRPKSGKISLNGIPTKERKVETLQDIFLVPEEFDAKDVAKELHQDAQGFLSELQ